MAGDWPAPQWGSLPFDKAIDFFKAKQLVPTEHWYDLQKEQHDTKFMVAGALKADLLKDFHEEVLRAMAEGRPLKEWQKEFDAIAAKHGWDYKGGRDWRSKIILETNIRTAYQAGRYAQMTAPEMLKQRPFWIYRHSDVSRRPRPLHVAWNGLILPADDPWWAAHYPPNGWNCRCRVFALSKKDLERMGRTPDRAPNDGLTEWVDPATGQTRQIPSGIDPGWDYAPGASVAERLRNVVKAKTIHLPAALKKELLADVENVVAPEVSVAKAPLTLDEAIRKGAAIYQSINGEIAPNITGSSYSHAWLRELHRRLREERGAGTLALQMDGAADAQEAVASAAQLYPATWVQSSNEDGGLRVTLVSWRANYHPFTKLLSTNHGAGSLNTTVHELAHRFQNSAEGVNDLFQELHDRRTAGAPLEKLADLYPHAGYGDDEYTRKDHYVDYYTGRVYGDSNRAWEVMSTAIESALAPRSGKLLDMMERDPELLHLALGVLFHYDP